MQNRPPSKPDPEVLAEPVAARLLERASELDAAHRLGSSVVNLRAAATEAGISAPAFDAALAELQGSRNAPVPAVAEIPWRRSWMRNLVVAAAALVALAAIAVFRQLTPAEVPGGPMVEKVIQLRCLSPVDAAELIRPLLGLPSNTVVIPPQSTRVLTIRATPTQLQNVKALLEKSEGAGSPACAARPPASGR